MLCASIPSYATEMDTYSDTELIDYSQRVDLFEKLGVFAVKGEAQDVVTRAEFAHMLRGFFGFQYGSQQVPSYSDIKGSEYYEDIVCAVSNGLMVSANDEQFYPEDPITTRDLSRGLVMALGYNKVVEIQYKDQEDGYVAEARNIKLFKGTASKDVSYAVTYAETLKVFENALRESTNPISISIDMKIQYAA